MLLAFAPGTDLSALWKAYIHGHYRRHPKTGQQVWVDSYSDKRPEKYRAEFAHWQHRIEHVKDHLAQGHTREALHAFHDLGHDDSHKLARDLGLHDDGPDFADKKTLMGAIHGRLLAKKHELQAQVGRQVKADFEKRKAAGTVGKRVGKARAKDTVTMPKKELIAEHEKLVAVLKSPDHADDLKEAKEQEKELKEYKQGPVVVFKKPTPALASSADGATLGSDRGGAPQAPAAGVKPMIDMSTPEMKTLAIKLAEDNFEQLGRGRVGRGELKQEFLDGKHDDLVAAAVAKQQASQAKVKAATASLTAPAGYTLTMGDKSISLKGPFDDDLHARIKRMGGYWDGGTRGNTKSWIIPADKAASLKRVLSNWGTPERVMAAATAQQQAASKLHRTKAEEWVGYVENHAKEGWNYDKGIDKLRELGVDQHPDLVARLAAAKALVAQQQAAKQAKAPTPAVTAAPVLKTYLNVPFAQKDEARRHGAKWDPANRAWYVVGEVPEALHKFWGQRPMPTGHFRIGGGQGYGYRELHPGETIRNPKADGPQWVTVVDASKQYYREDGMSFGVGDESGYVFSATVRPATPEEIAPHEQAEQERAHQQALRQRVAALAETFRQEGERPAAATVEGEKLLDTRTIYGGGAHWVIAPDAIWFVQGNGADGDNWAYNNVPSGIAWKLPRTPEAEQILREAAGEPMPKAEASASASVEWPPVPDGKQVMRVRVPEGSHAKTKDEVRHLVDFGSLKLVEPFRDFHVGNLVNYYDMLDDVDEVHVLGNDGKIFTFKQ